MTGCDAFLRVVTLAMRAEVCVSSHGRARFVTVRMNFLMWSCVIVIVVMRYDTEMIDFAGRCDTL